MDNPFDEILKAVRAVRVLDDAIKSQANAMANLLDGHLRGVSPYYLSKLKKQLQDFNAHTGKWKD